jgi:hypothetical protein
VREQPALRLASNGSGGAHKRTQVLAAGKGVQVLCADSRQAGNFIIRECLLSGFNGDHFRASLAVHRAASLRIKKTGSLTHTFPSNQPAVSLEQSLAAFVNLQAV